ncbi:hypothetical protein PBRA_007884 [Plasmodiophora brassicae]|uniref:Uncharacterized protein n=1 Tax=Plasmodiophora brassicae TaxID=37360 RepID=A0A0G4IXX5_PLABS|nr:hypothetical protein PBRA_007884 [Plasmodiophora brassicae]
MHTGRAPLPGCYAWPACAVVLLVLLCTRRCRGDDAVVVAPNVVAHERHLALGRFSAGVRPPLEQATVLQAEHSKHRSTFGMLVQPVVNDTVSNDDAFLNRNERAGVLLLLDAFARRMPQAVRNGDGPQAIGLGRRHDGPVRRYRVPKRARKVGGRQRAAGDRQTASAAEAPTGASFVRHGEATNGTTSALQQAIAERNTTISAQSDMLERYAAMQAALEGRVSEKDDVLNDTARTIDALRQEVDATRSAESLAQSELRATKAQVGALRAGANQRSAIAVICALGALAIAATKARPLVVVNRPDPDARLGMLLVKAGLVVAASSGAAMVLLAANRRQAFPARRHTPIPSPLANEEPAGASIVTIHALLAALVFVSISLVAAGIAMKLRRRPESDTERVFTNPV